MRLFPFVAAAAVLSAGLAAHADTMLTQSFTANTSSASTTISTSALNLFDTSQGVLDSVSLRLSGTATFRGAFQDDIDQFLNVSGIFAGSGEAFAGDAGQVNSFAISASGTEVSDLGFFDGTGQTTLSLHFVNLTTTSGVNGTLTYNYTPTTPVSATPEPSSVALLGTGLLGLAGVVRRRMA